MKRHQIESWIMASGERYCWLVNRETALPEFHPLLYVTTQVRGKSLSFSAMEKAFSSIGVLLDFLHEQKMDDLALRFLKRDFFTPDECQALRDHCRWDFGRRNTSRSADVIQITGKKGYSPAKKKVLERTESTRLTYIAQYLEWLAKHLLRKSFDREASIKVEAMKNNLLTLRSVNKGRAGDLEDTKGLSHEQERLLIEIAGRDSELNPFTGKDIRVRNELIIHVLRGLGVRGGELLNIRVDDIDFKRNEILIRRRADAKSDPRIRQPLVKTKARRIPLGPQLTASFRYYIVQVRRRIPNASRYPYVFVTHKSGPTQGHPMSIETYKQVIRKMSGAHPLLAGFTGHDLRHTWNDRYSEHMDRKANPESETTQERVREDLMGWAEDSGTAKLYNKRFIRKKGREVGLELQEMAYEAAVSAKTSEEKPTGLRAEGYEKGPIANTSRIDE